MVCALPSAARRTIYAKIQDSAEDDDAQADAATALTTQWTRLGVPKFDVGPFDRKSGEGYATALYFSTRADIRAAVVALLEARGVSSPAPKQPKKRA